jgi:hypothetical protein
VTLLLSFSPLDGVGLLDLFYASSPESQDDGNGSNDRSMSMSGASHSSESHEVDADSTGPARTIPQVELQTTPPFSTFVSDPNSTSNMYRSYPATSSFSIPGAMAIDPYVRGVASAAGTSSIEMAVTTASFLFSFLCYIFLCLPWQE